METDTMGWRKQCVVWGRPLASLGMIAACVFHFSCIKTNRSIISADGAIAPDAKTSLLVQKTNPSAMQCDPSCLKKSMYLKPCVVDPQINFCVPCLNDAHCHANPIANGPWCDPIGKVCGCYTNQDCRQNPNGHLCIQLMTYSPGPIALCSCIDNSDCPSGRICGAYGQCEDPCFKDEDCLDRGADKVCDPNFGCVECRVDRDCDDEMDGYHCLHGACGCDSDVDCLNHPKGNKCIQLCLGKYRWDCISFCGCKQADDCPANESCKINKCVSLYDNPR